MDCELVPADARPEACSHLVLLLHGLGGNARDWNSVVRSIRKHASHEAGIAILRPSLALRATLSGAETCAHLALEEVKAALGYYRSLRYCSIVALSFGGIYGRLLIERMVDQGLLGPVNEAGCPAGVGLQAISFMTVATPHLGVRRSRPNSGFGWAFHKMASCFGCAPRLVQEVMLEDNPEAPMGPMLLRLVQDDCLNALRIFRHRSCYANVFYDFMVPYGTAAIESCNPFEDRRSRDIERLESFRSIARADLSTGQLLTETAGTAMLLNEDPKKPLLEDARDRLNHLGWQKFACLLPALPNAHNAIVGNSLVCWQGRDIAEHIAMQVLENAVA
mmetsp:Transcript_127914/g.239243  ORF Transcript_127914/g.239243 Transcript_127914/m.239243 type:complete len:334 (-) Transcript_127914:69-1070(-)